jgi:hypothetical protein
MEIYLLDNLNQSYNTIKSNQFLVSSCQGLNTTFDCQISDFPINFIKNNFYLFRNSFFGYPNSTYKLTFLYYDF